tara:strand:+ start:813 stop:1019 length:207 start_codon:yes stop_codon:yes gene_type:complete
MRDLKLDVQLLPELPGKGIFESKTHLSQEKNKTRMEELDAWMFKLSELVGELGETELEALLLENLELF